MKSILLAVFSLALFTSTAHAAEPELMAAVSVMGYGYKVKVLVNGADIGVEGGKSENRRLFNKGNDMAAQAAPAIRAKNFVLVPGINEIAIEYARIDPKGTDSLEIAMQAQGYPQPVLSITSKTRPADKLLLKVNLAPKAPADFKPVVITQ
jgi:hypothetical protein